MIYGKKGLKGLGGRKVKFSFESSNAKEVRLTGDFNSWDKTGYALKKEKDNLWKKELSLKPGKYEYKFIVDGNWVCDPKSNTKVRNTFGTDNSVTEVI